MSWQMVDEGWGRKAVDFATLAEPSACREYVAVHHRLGLRDGDRLLDMACGPGLVMELVRAQGAVVSGIDASPRLVAVARDRNPGSDMGPSYESMEIVGEVEFLERARALAESHVRDGLPLRGEIQEFGYVGTKV